MSTGELLLVLALLAACAVAVSLHARRRSEAARHAHELAQERARHQAALAAESARVAAQFDRMLDGVIIVGAAGHIAFANRAAATLFGGSPMTGRTVLEATRRHELAAILGELEAQPEVLGHEVRLERLGAVRTIVINALALTAADGARDGALLVLHDVTRLRELESVRQDFVANVSHELRTPLSLIKSAAETLIDGGKADPIVTDRFLDIIDKNANRLTLLIDDLLLLSKLDSGRLELHLQPVAMQRAVQDAIDDAALIARTREVSLSNEVPADLVGRADPDRLRQVLTNLIDNAIKYGRAQGAVAIGGRRADDRHIEVSVRDDGPGIPPEAKARIFERFYRIDKARAREQGGTGLGLAIVKNVIESHGGDVRVESAPGQGTTFFFTLPVPPESRTIRA